MLFHPSVHDLKCFVTLARLGSMRRAADHEHVSPSAISRQIARLEDAVGKPLFERRPDGVALTPVGEIVLRHAEEVLRQMVDLGFELDAQNRAGTVRIVSIEGITRSFLAPIMGQLRRDTPDIFVSLRVLGRDRVLSAIEDYEAEIGAVYDHFSNPAVAAVARWKQPLLAFVRAGHPALDGGGFDPAAWDYALPDDSFGIRQLVNAAFHKRRLPLAPVIVANQLQFLIQTAIESDVVTLMPLQAARIEVERGALVPVETGFQELDYRFVSFIVHRTRPRAAHVQALLDLLVARIAAAETADRQLLANR